MYPLGISPFNWGLLSYLAPPLTTSLSSLYNVFVDTGRILLGSFEVFSKLSNFSSLIPVLWPIWSSLHWNHVKLSMSVLYLGGKGGTRPDAILPMMSQNHLGGKWLLRSLNPTVNPTLPNPTLTHVLKCCVYFTYLYTTVCCIYLLYFKYHQGWWLHCFPVLMLEHTSH